LRQLAALPDLDVRAGLANLADHQGTYLRLLKSFAHGRAECTAEFRSLLAAGDPRGAPPGPFGQGQLRHSRHGRLAAKI
jgi:hypothetical protein